MKYPKRIILLFFLPLFFYNSKAQPGNAFEGNFPPPTNPVSIYAERATGQIIVDGKLDETDWTSAQPVMEFRQVEPFQGELPDYPTTVRILFDNRYVYFSAFCRDTAGRSGVRVQDFRRDFEYFENDLFSVALDPFNQKQNASVFQTNPYGSLSDLQVVNGVVDREWDALWTARSNVTDSGWTCEIAIPWKTLRYPTPTNKDSVGWGISFNRIARRTNENSAFPVFPRSFVDTYRMDYIALLKGIEPPPPSTNIHINPYLVNQIGRTNETGTKTNDFSQKFGGEIKWNPTAHTTLDFTANTDFAQAEADREVNNLSRFSVFFPERRQFFLENAGLFDTGNSASFKPFHSRTIGLDKDGNPIPIDAGLRITDKNKRYSTGALYIHQANSDNTPSADISLARIIRNYGRQNNIGILFTNRIDQKTDSLNTNINSTLTLTGFNRFNDKLNFKYAFSGSATRGNMKDNGTAAATGLSYLANNFALTWNFSLVSDQYNSQVGYIRRDDFFKNFIETYLIRRKQKWLPGFIRSWQPGFSLDEFQNIRGLGFQEINFKIAPFVFVFNNGAKFDLNERLLLQNLVSTFRPLNIEIAPGRYRYNTINLDYRSNQSSRFSWETNISTGGYYNGRLTSFSGALRYAPVKYFAANVNYEINKLKNVGVNREDLTSQLLTPNIRMALNPRVLLNIFYQTNTTTGQHNWNTRFSWEYKPSSYIYLLWNQNNKTGFRQNEGIAKITYLKQF